MAGKVFTESRMVTKNTVEYIACILCHLVSRVQSCNFTVSSPFHAFAVKLHLSFLVLTEPSVS